MRAEDEEDTDAASDANRTSAQGPDRRVDWTDEASIGEMLRELGSCETDIVPVAVGPSPPFDADDLRRAFRFVMSPEEADQFVDDLTRDGELHRPGAIWVGDTFLHVALLSPEHERKIGEYLGLSNEQLQHELDRVRRNLSRRHVKHS